MGLVLVVDVGTTNIKAGIVDERGKLLSSAEIENEIFSPEIGASEHDPEALFNSLLAVSAEAVKGYTKEVEFMVLSSYQLGLLPVDANMKPLMGIMTLLDTRAQTHFGDLIKDIDTEKLYRNTGCPPSYLYPFAKLLWMKEFKSEVFNDARYFLGSKDYLIYRLSGKVTTEASISSATQMFNINCGCWDEYALSLIGINEEKLPRIVYGDSVVGEILPEIRERIGLKHMVYLLPGVYDGGGLVIGLGGLEAGIGSVNLGTTSMLRVTADRPVLDRDKRLQTYLFLEGNWLTGEGINNAGVVLKWFKDNLVNKEYNELTSMAEDIHPGADGLLFLPYLTGERDCRIGSSSSGVLFGLKEYHTAAHIVRAILEGVSYTIKLVKDTLEENGIVVSEIRVGGSGTKSKLWLKIIADITGVPVRKSICKHVTFVGEAMLGYIAMGVYRNIKEASRGMVALEDKIFPEEKHVELYDHRYSTFCHLISCMRDIQETT